MTAGEETRERLRVSLAAALLLPAWPSRHSFLRSFLPPGLFSLTNGIRPVRQLRLRARTAHDESDCETDCKLKGVTHAPAFRVHSTWLERVAATRHVLSDSGRDLVSGRSTRSSRGTATASIPSWVAAWGMSQSRLAPGHSGGSCLAHIRSEDLAFAPSFLRSGRRDSQA